MGRFSTIRMMMKTAAVSVSVLIFLLPVLEGCSQSRTEKMDVYMDRAHEVWNFNGAVLVASRGETILKNGYGWADIEERLPNSPDTKFLLGSITKQFTAAAILHLAEQGKIELDMPVTEYLTDYPKDPGDRISIHHLLSHTSGIPSVNPELMKMADSETVINPQQLIATFIDKPLEFEPGEMYRYSNCGYALLGAVVEAVSCVSYGEYLLQAIFKPLGMHNTGIVYDYDSDPGFAVGYQEGPDKNLSPAPYIHPSLGFSAGSLSSTVEDLFRWDQGLYTEKILSTEWREKLFTANLGDYGYGWIVENVRGHKIVGHGGGVPGFMTWIERWVDDSLVIIVLSNNVNAPVMTIAGGLGRIMLDEDYRSPATVSPVELNPGALAEYAGVFEIGPGDLRTVVFNNGSLYVQRGDTPRRRIIAQGNDLFFIESDPTVTLEFTRDETGLISGQILHFWIKDEEAGKVTGKYR